MQVLLVEDDERLAAMLVDALSQAGMGVVAVSEADAALDVLDERGIDVVVLDVMLPGRLDGFELCAELRRRRHRVPVLMLTALDAVDERVRGLEVGADDYLVKPFALRELVARIRALVRRHLEGRQAVLHAGDVELDTRTFEVNVAGTRLPLTSTEHALLEYLILHRGQVLSRSRLEDAVWPGGPSGESNLLEVYVSRLRRKLRAVGASTTIEAVRGVGYRLRTE